MIETGYKANTIRWTHEGGFERTDNIIVGRLYKNPQKGQPWTIAYKIVEGVSDGHMSVKSYMVDKDTVEKVKVRRVTDEVKKVYWFLEVQND